jgi:PDZ domain
MDQRHSTRIEWSVICSCVVFEFRIHALIFVSVLEGVLRVSRSELNEKMMDTADFFVKIEKKLKTWAESKTSKPLSPVSTLLEQQQQQQQQHYISQHSLVDLTETSSPVMASSESTNDFLALSADKCARLIESIVRMPTPITKLMMADWESWPDPTLGLSIHTDLNLDTDCVTGHDIETGQSKLSSTPVSVELAKLTMGNFCTPPPPWGHKFTLLYTDLYHTSPEEKTNLSIALQGEQFSMPGEIDVDDQACKKTIVLCRPPQSTVEPSSLPEYKGKGWGFELVRWQNEGCMRVGRVHPSSPAYIAGLQTHDVILSINGREVGKGTPWTTPLIICSILSSTLCVGRANNRLDVMASAIRIIGSQGPVKGPVVLQVLRKEVITLSTSVQQLENQLHARLETPSTARTQTIPMNKMYSPVHPDVRTFSRDHRQDFQPPSGNHVGANTTLALQRRRNDVPPPNVGLQLGDRVEANTPLALQRRRNDVAPPNVGLQLGDRVEANTPLALQRRSNDVPPPNIGLQLGDRGDADTPLALRQKSNEVSLSNVGLQGGEVGSVSVRTVEVPNPIVAPPGNEPMEFQHSQSHSNQSQVQMALESSRPSGLSMRHLLVIQMQMQSRL